MHNADHTVPGFTVVSFRSRNGTFNRLRAIILPRLPQMGMRPAISANVFFAHCQWHHPILLCSSHMRHARTCFDNRRRKGSSGPPWHCHPRVPRDFPCLPVDVIRLAPSLKHSKGNSTRSPLLGPPVPIRHTARPASGIQLYHQPGSDKSSFSAMARIAAPPRMVRTSGVTFRPGSQGEDGQH